MKLTRRVLKRGRIEIIPMIDTILILLIFYMSFSTFSKKEKRIDSKLPIISTKQAKKRDGPPILDIVLHVIDRNHISVNGNMMGFDDLVVQMSGLAGLGSEATIVIDADAGTSYGDVVGALDACARANLTNVAFRPIPEKVAK